MKLAALLCPRCGGELDDIGQNDVLRCPYCGTSLLIERSQESIGVQIVERSEAGKTERAKIKLELEKLKIQAKDDQSRLSVRLIVCCFAMAIVLPLIVGALSAAPGMLATASGKIAAPLASEGVEGLDVNDLKMRFEDVGFENIELIPMKDIDWISGLYLDEGTVDHVTMDGESDFTEESYYAPSDPIRIFYHSNAG